MDSNTQKYNKLSIASFVLVIIGFLFLSINLAFFGAICVLTGFILGIISYVQIKKTKEKGTGLLIALLVIFILIVLSMLLLYLPIF